jgi:chorismate-pyruvate lyase
MAELDPGARLRKLFDIFAGAALPEGAAGVGWAPPTASMKGDVGSAHPTVPEFEVVPGDQVPQPYRDLLVHDQHMTVTLERFHGRPVELRVLARHVSGSEYARMILLALEGTDEIVEFGIFRMDLACCDQAVQAEILAGKTPLGRILIEHNVLRRIDPTAFLKIRPNSAIREWFGIPGDQPAYGRLASIFCNNVLAIELLEVVRPDFARSK